ncbi:MAG TPA: transporter [Methylocella sp.]|nr:transporter [Methylocella sp.]
MDKSRALQKASGAACLAASLLVTQPSKAVEFGFSEYFLGLTIPMSGYLPPPGVYFSNTFLLYQGSRPALSANLVTDIAQVGYYLDADVFGGTFGLFATVPYIGDRNSTPGSVSRQYAAISSISDTDYSAVLGWHAGDNNWCFVLTGFAPTGNFNPQRFVQTGLNRPALDIKGAYTFLSQQTGTEVSAALGTTFNAYNTASNYQSGAELHFEWALNQHLPIGLAAGVGGYFYQQLTADYGSGDTVGSFKGRVAAVGPLLSYSFKAGAQEVDVSARWFHEFAVVNRTRGDLIYASLSFKL